MAINIKLEIEAAKVLTEFLECADRTQRFYQTNRLPMPDVLRRVLGTNGGSSASAEVLQAAIPPMPAEAEPDWTWIKAEDAAPITLVKAILRDAGDEHLHSKQLFDRIVKIRPSSSLNVVSNAAVRLMGNGTVLRDSNGAWYLRGPIKGGILYEGFLWGPQDFFTLQEVAANRRIAILVILKQFSDGLQMSQITELLRKTDWLRAPVNKDLVKADLEVLMGENKVRRKMGNSKKWELAQQEEQ